MTDMKQRAREVASDWCYKVYDWRGRSPEFMQAQVSRLTENIAAAIQSVVSEEREECAKLFCEFCRFTTSPAKYIEGNWYHYDLAHPNNLCKSAAIRARGQKVLDNNTNVR